MESKRRRRCHGEPQEERATSGWHGTWLGDGSPGSEGVQCSVSTGHRERKSGMEIYGLVTRYVRQGRRKSMLCVQWGTILLLGVRGMLIGGVGLGPAPPNAKHTPVPV